MYTSFIVHTYFISQRFVTWLSVAVISIFLCTQILCMQTAWTQSTTHPSTKTKHPSTKTKHTSTKHKMLKNKKSLKRRPIVIAHRGASGYLPEHTLEAKALAYAMKPDYIEQDVVMSKDDHLIILHDRYLDRVSDVAQKFPHRARKDGRYYAIDFTLAEIKSLQVTEGFTYTKQGKKVMTHPHRFPLGKSSFQVATLAEEIELIQGLNQTLGYNVGLYPEIKAPWFHRHEGKDISLAVLKMLKAYG